MLGRLGPLIDQRDFVQKTNKKAKVVLYLRFFTNNYKFNIQLYMFLLAFLVEFANAALLPT
jgi:hypothetical protein